MEGNMLVELYWKYFVAGLAVYIGARLIYIYIEKQCKSKKPKNTNNEVVTSKNTEPEQAKELDSEDEEVSDDDIQPALPNDLKHVPLHFEKFSVEDMIRKSQDFFELMDNRRSVRHFSKEPVPIEVIRNIIRTAGTSPSGAHTEPWSFVVISDEDTKLSVRRVVERQEEINYKKRMGKEWVTDLKPLKTSWSKPYLLDAPYLILVFKKVYSVREDGKIRRHYYHEQSLSIAVGILIAAIHNAGLATVVSTPLNCSQELQELLQRDKEKLVFLLPVGYPSEDCLVPDLKRKPLEDIITEIS